MRFKEEHAHASALTRILRAALIALCCALARGAQAADMRILVRKEARTLEVLQDDHVVKTFSIALGFDARGTKIRQGDGKTPEGTYFVRVKNAKSQFYLSLGLDYPGPTDAARGLKDGLIDKTQYARIVEARRKRRMPAANTKLGGEIFIHGGGVGRDWTFGCIALENANVKTLFDATPIGTRVDILP